MADRSDVVRRRRAAGVERRCASRRPARSRLGRGADAPPARLGRGVVRARRGARALAGLAGALAMVFVLAPLPGRAATPLSAARQEGAGIVRGVVRGPEGPVYAATVRLVRDGAPVAETDTDREGRFELGGVPPGRLTLRVSRLGYLELVRPITVRPGGTTELELELETAAVALEGVDVETARSRARARFEEVAGISVRELGAEQIRLVPGVAEADPLRAVEVLPGVVSTSDFSSAFHVRGGSQDQNLILLDDVPVFSPFHLGGFFSVFNADMVERAELASGGFPARHGGRVSSVLTVVSDPGDGPFGVEGGVSLLATRVAVGGGAGAGVRDALGIETLRWRVSGRRSYFDKVLGPFFEFPYHLTDLQGVAEAGRGRDRFRLTAYTGSDVLDLTDLDDEDFPLRVDWDWGNDVAGLTWERGLERGRWRATASLSRFGSALVFPDFDDTELRTFVSQRRLATLAEQRVAPWLALVGGASVDRFAYDNLARTGGTEFGQGRAVGYQTAAFAEGHWGEPGRWLLETGLRLDRWDPDRGPTVHELAPRVSAKRFFDDARWALRASVGRYTQFLHSLRDEELPLGIDVWILAGARAPHVVSDQVQAGLEAFLDERWSLSVEAFHRSFDGVVTFNGGDDPNTDLDDLLEGTGTSWGADLLVERTAERAGEGVSGWLALSFLKAVRTFPDPLSPLDPSPEVTYPPIFDRRLDADLVLRFPGPFGWDAGLRLNVGTGIPYTRPRASYVAWQPRFLLGGGGFLWEDVSPGGDDDGEGSYAVLLGDRNAARYPAYHRLDLSFRRTYEKSWGTLTPHVDILNVYNRRNVLFYFYEFERDPPVRSGISMFPVLPTVGVEVRFR